MDVEAGTVEVPGGRLAYERTGDGPAVTLLHPGLWDMRSWDGQVGAFAEAFTVLRYDLRGFGRSDAPTAPYSQVDDLSRFLDALGIDRTALVGCSRGGRIAVEFATVHPERVWALVPVAAGLSGVEWPDDKWEPLYAPIEEAVAAGDLERAADLEVRIFAPLGVEDAIGRRLRRIALDNRRQLVIDESLDRPTVPPAIERLEEIRAPTLVVLGAADHEEFAEIGDLLASRIPGAAKVILEGADHVVNMRQPEAFNRIVLAFLSAHAPG